MSRCKLRFLTLLVSFFTLALAYLTLPISTVLTSVGLLKWIIYGSISIFLITICHLAWKFRSANSPGKFFLFTIAVFIFAVMITIQKYDAERIHLILYALLSILYLETFFYSASRGQTIAFTLLTITFFALLDEGLQSIIPGRFFEWHDIATDVIAAALGLVFRGALMKSY